MEVYEKINYFLQEKKIVKKDFVKNLLLLEPKLKITGEVPTEQSIYRYLNGRREIRVELLPYIAEVLGVSEQDLFSFEIEYTSEYNIKYSRQAREIVDLLQYAPKITIEHILTQLRKHKELHKESTKQIS